ncbi:hypothetical protein ACH5RR_015688 [Cinchona calisaya]|uniref:Uncharacterized protein n=1 Tax=Cinchona calisaya TaxID=153742 RepID=A0ABD2ZTW4_9GENT
MEPFPKRSNIQLFLDPADKALLDAMSEKWTIVNSEARDELTVEPVRQSLISSSYFSDLKTRSESAPLSQEELRAISKIIGRKLQVMAQQKEVVQFKFPTKKVKKA